MNIPCLNKRDVLVCEHEGGFLLYAPLANVVAVASAQEVATLEQNLAEGRIDDTLEALLANEGEGVEQLLPWNEQNELTILLNQRCNFSCSYCYSKDGRDKTQLDIDTIKAALDQFLRAERCTPQGSNGTDCRRRPISITFSGGGDPILSFDIFQQAVAHAQRLASERGIEVEMGIVTNGSKLEAEHIAFIKENGVELVVSCDILEDVHNAQRSHYDVVSQTIDTLCREGLSIGLRSTITPLNVERMVEMVDEMHRRFPLVQGAAFEPVLNKELFPTSQELSKFYARFAQNIFEAIERGHHLGLVVGNTVVNNVDTCKVRSCMGKTVLTPHGTVVACSRISSPREAHYKDFLYGKATAEHGISIDQTRYEDIFAHDANTHTACLACLAKYHCSGGCLLARKSLPQDYIDAYCRFQRQMVKHVLVKRMNNEANEE